VRQFGYVTQERRFGYVTQGRQFGYVTQEQPITLGPRPDGVNYGIKTGELIKLALSAHA
jgi:hypothetical protein